ncbi:GAF and ANTAR domain-containing protein [Knoellia sp. LjRoot47]|uniref:GAF and ANTAR domain-containing protein n=1 Tax=Knoellia sp. LjRoot47 TaxID=3342330 RepID=UPI003ED0405C
METVQLMQHLGTQFSELSAALLATDGSGLDPDRVVRFAAMAVPSTHHCGLTLLRPKQAPHTVSSTDELSRNVDRIQYALGEGPCLDAAEAETAEIAGQLDTDERWPRFGPRCVEETGVLSMLSIRLAMVGQDQAAMNFYSRERDAFGELELAVASIFAPFAALSVEHTLRERDARNFEAALSSSRQIGTAIGILMAQRRITSKEAFSVLRRASQHLNRKLRDVAEEVERTGALPVRASSPLPDDEVVDGTGTA